MILTGTSSSLFSSILSSEKSSIKSRKILTIQSKISKVDNFTSLGISFNQPVFFDEAAKLLSSVGPELYELIEKEKQSSFKYNLNSQIEKIAFFKSQNSKGLTVTRRELLEYLKESEKLSQAVLLQEQINWNSKSEVLSFLSKNVKKINYLIMGLLGICSLALTMLSRSWFKQNEIEKQLNEKEKIHSTLFASLTDSVFLCTPEGVVKACNNSCTQFIGKDAREIVGQNIIQFLISVNFLDNSFTPFKRSSYLIDILEKGKSMTNLHLSLLTAEGELKWYELNTQPIHTGNSNGEFQIILSFGDITEKVRMQKSMEQQKEKMLEASQLQTVGEMASGLAHEINNPLSVISMSAKRVDKKLEKGIEVDATTVKKMTGKVLKTVDRISKIVKSILQMSHKTDNEFETTTMGEIIQMTVDLSQHTLRQNGTFLKLPTDELSILLVCNPIQISQIMLNLIKNANDAISELDEKWIEIRIEEIENEVVISVTDSGSTIDEDTADKILRPFYTTKEVGKGTGLGLSISRTLAETHGGSLKVDSDSSNACFVLKLPKVASTHSEEDFKAVA